jgi:hypothetical protein
MELPVYIAQANLIHINQSQRTDTGTRQSLNHPGTNATQTNHSNPSGLQTRQARRSI